MERGAFSCAWLLAGALFGCADVTPQLYDAGAFPASTPFGDAGAGNAVGADASDARDAASPVDGAIGTGGASGWRSQVLYLVLPDRFTNGDPTNDANAGAACLDPNNPRKLHGGDLAGLRTRVGYLRELGVTALWVTPQYKEAPGRCGYHGYWADFVDPDDGAIDPTLGTAADLQGLVGDLHGAGMRFVLDMVVNHAGRGARVVAQHPDWFHDPATCAALGDPGVYCPIGGNPLPDFAQEKPEVASYLTAMCASWAARFGIDGIRMDTVKNVPLAYWTQWAPAMRAVRADLFTVGEVFDEGAAADLTPYLDAGFTSLFNYPLFAALGATFAAGGSVDRVADKVAEEIGAFGYERLTMMTSFIDNHDNPRFASVVPAGTAEDEIVRREHLALGAIFTLPGIPQLYYGDELALYGAADPDNRRDMPAWAWTAADRGGTHAGAAPPNAQSTFAYVQKLIATRGAHAALQRGSYAELWRQAGGAANVLAFFRGADADRVVVAINNGRETASVALPIGTSHTIPAADRAALPQGTAFDDLLGEGAPTTVSVGNGTLAITLPAQTIGIYLARATK